ncbi:pol-like protein, yeast-enriched transcript [Histoplasma ohiense]|nr:pol-like protein, yeast-enriched transcript [Histoplasma ohiense (nom. inval.)]
MTGPDIAYAVGKLTKLTTFMTNPSERHSAEIDCVIIYLRDTKNLAIEYNGPDNDALSMNVVEAASDASFVGNSGRRSTEGYIFKLFGGPVDWKSKRQKVKTTSTTEAELLAVSQAGKESIWWKRFFDHLGFDPGYEISIKCDNRQTIGILNKEDSSITTKLRHVDI